MVCVCVCVCVCVYMCVCVCVCVCGGGVQAAGGSSASTGTGNRRNPILREGPASSAMHLGAESGVLFLQQAGQAPLLQLDVPHLSRRGEQGTSQEAPDLATRCACCARDGKHTARWHGERRDARARAHTAQGRRAPLVKNFDHAHSAQVDKLGLQRGTASQA